MHGNFLHGDFAPEVVDPKLLDVMKEAYIIATKRLDVLASIAEDEGVTIPENLIYEQKATIASCLNRFFKCGMANECAITNEKLKSLVNGNSRKEV